MWMKRFIKDVVYKISLQKIKKKFLKTNSKSVYLWKAIKSLGLPNKSGGCIVGALAENQMVKHDTKSILKTFNFFFQTWQGIY